MKHNENHLKTFVSNNKNNTNNKNNENTIKTMKNNQINEIFKKLKISKQVKHNIKLKSIITTKTMKII